MKRGESGLSLLVVVNKPLGMTSHDVVNRCRRIFGERRVGHTGTLDPQASGVLPICIGPATRLDKYLTGHEKRYIATIGFGFETTTDDAAGTPTVTGPIDPLLCDVSYAESFIPSLVGKHEQMPPAYSAIKKDGVKAYEAARKGQDLELEFRTIEILQADFLDCFHDDGLLCWKVAFTVSKGTYIRSLARDIGRILGTPAHLRDLKRVSSGGISIQQAVSLETLETLKADAAIDPMRALGLRYAFADEVERFVGCGNALHPEQVKLNEALVPEMRRNHCACMGSTQPSAHDPADGELAGMLVANRLKAIYRYDGAALRWKPDCVFSTGIFRG